MNPTQHEIRNMVNRGAAVRAARAHLRPTALSFDDIATEGAFDGLLRRLPHLGVYKRPGEWVRVNMTVVFTDHTELTWRGSTEGLRLRLITLSTQLPFASHPFGLAWITPPCEDDGVRGEVALYRIPRGWGEYLKDRRGE